MEDWIVRGLCPDILDVLPSVMKFYLSRESEEKQKER